MPTSLARVLDELRRASGISKARHVVQLDREAVGLAGVGEQLLGLLDVARPLRDRGVGGREDGRERAVVAEVGLALEEPLHERLAVDQERHRLPDALVR